MKKQTNTESILCQDRPKHYVCIESELTKTNARPGPGQIGTEWRKPRQTLILHRIKADPNQSALNKDRDAHKLYVGVESDEIYTVHHEVR